MFLLLRHEKCVIYPKLVNNPFKKSDLKKPAGNQPVGKNTPIIYVIGADTLLARQRTYKGLQKHDVEGKKLINHIKVC